MRYTLAEFQALITKINPNLHIISDYLPSSNEKERKKAIKMHCDICGADYDTTRNALNSLISYNKTKRRKKRYVGCPVCDGKKIVKGINDIATLYPDVAKYYVDKNYVETHSIYTDKTGLAKCAYCGAEKMLIPYLIRHANGFPCDICRDGLSYPNKFSRYLFQHLPVENYIPEYRPLWAKKYSYDNYFEYLNSKFIVEMDGNLGHGNTTYRSMRPDFEGIKRDQVKDTLAKKHGINIIRIDCKESSCEYIKRNIYNSIIGEMFDLSEINWTECELYCRSNLFKEVCEMYKNNCNERSIVKRISEHFGLGETTIRRYLKHGEEVGLLTYIKHTTKGYHNSNKIKPVYVYDLEGTRIGIYKHCGEAERGLAKIYGKGTYQSKTINKVANGKQKHKYKQLLFFYEEQQEIKNEYKTC